MLKFAGRCITLGHYQRTWLKGLKNKDIRKCGSCDRGTTGCYVGFLTAGLSQDQVYALVNKFHPSTNNDNTKCDLTHNILSEDIIEQTMSEVLGLYSNTEIDFNYVDYQLGKKHFHKNLHTTRSDGQRETIKLYHAPERVTLKHLFQVFKWPIADIIKLIESNSRAIFERRV